MSATPFQIEDGLSGRFALVTGGSRGIGRSIVEQLAKAGMDVTFTYLGNESAANAVISENPDLKIAAAKVDGRDSAAVNAAIEALVERTGRIDVLVNNAGVIRDNLLPMLEDDDLKAVFETNIEGVFHFCRAVVPHMMSKRYGRIVNLSSVSATKGGRGQTNYAASKGAIKSFTQALAVEVGRRHIRVNAVAPGVIETDMSAEVRSLGGDEILSNIVLKRYGQPAEIAEAVWFLSSDLSGYITGQVLSVDGGLKM
jgi:3-oxoacyl-[acyl-carrier protein] reductase